MATAEAKSLTSPLKGCNVAIDEGRRVCCNAGIQLEELHQQAHRCSGNARASHDARDALQAVAPEPATSQDKCQAGQHKQYCHNVGSACTPREAQACLLQALL